MIKKKFYILFLLIAATPAGAQTADRRAYKIRAAGKKLIVKFQGKSHRLETGGRIDAAKVTDAVILFAGRKEGFTYLVVDVSGPSRVEGNDRQCGAGTEANLIWLKLDGAWKPAAVDSVRYESCWSAVDMGDGPRINGPILTAVFENFREGELVRLTYNADEPEKGFRLEKTKSKDE